MGSYSEIAMEAIDQLRDRNEKVGLIRLRLWRPFPFEELRKATGRCQTLVVLDRCISPGGPPGPVCSEVKAALYSQKKRPKIAGFIGGLGGRDLSVPEFVKMIERGKEIAEAGGEEVETIGVRGQ
jgi:pyruvate ferredoxin oxidoreductase alpha subunit